MGSFVQKSQTGWNLQYTSDEKLCARAVTNEVQFYQSGDLSTVWNKLRIEGVTDFALSPGNSQSIAVFVPERKVCYLQRWWLDMADGCRDNPLRSGSSLFLSLAHRSRRRASLKATKCS